MQFPETNTPTIEELNENGADMEALELTADSEALDLPESEGRSALTGGLLSCEINMGLYRRRRMLVSR